jgi:hypothetical protein
MRRARDHDRSERRQCRAVVLVRSGGVTAAVAFTVVVNVPINLATGRWDAEHPPADWQRTRNRWELFQGVRSWLLLAGFVLVCAAAAGTLTPGRVG